MDKKKKHSKTKDLVFLSISTIIVGIALFFLLSPIIQNRFIERKKITDIINEFEETLDKKDSSVINLNESEENDNKVIGVIYIPKINIILPVYNNSDEYAISNGAGIMKEYGHPNGKLGTHAVITSHAGQKSGLFTDLYRLKIGDSFFIKDEKGQMSKYNIVEENVVLPEDFSKLGPKEGKCYITLLTCTPLGINTHRLLQKGEKGEFDMDEFLNMKNPFYISKYEIYQLGISIVLLIILFRSFYSVLKTPKKNKEK